MWVVPTVQSNNQTIFLGGDIRLIYLNKIIFKSTFCVIFLIYLVNSHVISKIMSSEPAIIAKEPFRLMQDPSSITLSGFFSQQWLVHLTLSLIYCHMLPSIFLYWRVTKRHNLKLKLHSETNVLNWLSVWSENGNPFLLLCWLAWGITDSA